VIFSQEQIEGILNIIDFQHSLFIGVNIGVDILTKEDKKLLKKYGIDIESIKTDFTPFEQEFYFGRLSAALGAQNASTLVYNDFLQYLRRGQYIPLNTREKETLKFLKQRTYSHIKNLGQKVKQTTSGFIIEEDQAVRDAYEKTIKDSLERAIIERDTVNSVVSEIGHKTGDWSRDLGKIAQTEMQNAFEYGRGSEIEKNYGKEAEVYKEVYKGACRFCIKFYTTNGIGSPPKIFKLNELIANGTNAGKKQSDWKPVLYAVHPFCRCLIRYKPKGYIWNDELKMFTAPKIDKTKPKKGITITVGTKVFNI
jgi:hypothetical protein